LTVLDPDPYSGSKGAISIRIHMDPDRKHWHYQQKRKMEKRNSTFLTYFYFRVLKPCLRIEKQLSRIRIRIENHASGSRSTLRQVIEEHRLDS